MCLVRLVLLALDILISFVLVWLCISIKYFIKNFDNLITPSWFYDEFKNHTNLYADYNVVRRNVMFSLVCVILFMGVWGWGGGGGSVHRMTRLPPPLSSEKDHERKLVLPRNVNGRLSSYVGESPAHHQGSPKTGSINGSTRMVYVLYEDTVKN